MKNIQNKTLLKIAVTAVLACLTVIYFTSITGFISFVLNVCFPLILGCILAFILDILLKRLEAVYFPKSRNRRLIRSRRPVCIVLALLLLTLIILLIVLIVIPEMVTCFQFIALAVPPLFDDLSAWLSETFNNIPLLQQALSELNINWQELFSTGISTFMTGASDALTSIVNILMGIINGFIQFFVAVIFAIYILANKEKLKHQAVTLMNAYMKPSWQEKLLSVLRISNRTFSNFIAGQCTEAFIFGLLCTLGMFLFRFPYPVTIGILTGVTALIPVIGAFIGAAVGAIMILTVSPLQMIFFLIFLIVLQQIEGNFIYPRVVGSAVSLPGLWTLVAVTLGGGLLGIMGIFICVPAAAVIYQLLRQNVKHRLTPQPSEESGSEKSGGSSDVS